MTRCRASGCRLRRCTSRPPARRTSASGQTNRTMASTRSARRGVRSHFPASGVPSIGMRKLTGTESGSSSRSAKTTSTRSASLSPMPAISPEQADRPAACACWTVETRSEKSCVVQMSPYVASEVFRLWLYASAPAARSRSACPCESSPRHAHTSTSACCSLMVSMVRETRSTSRSLGPRPLATRQTRFAPPATPAAAAFDASSGFSQLYLRISAREPSRCEQ